MPIRSSGKRMRRQGVSLNAKQQREAIHLYRTSGLSVEAIGERFGVSPWVISELLKREL